MHWQPATDEARARFEAGRLRYEDRREKQMKRQASLEWLAVWESLVRRLGL